ncbi:MAG TPA: pyridine nucleotide-disulfide oxidoreductase, partial [Terrimesophilobacter sp.]|nr:pyridine nucleotide-disulfide oxidoreductase [Terrimesophilobacter sp.]
ESESFRSLKLGTRAGLGICQGRMCGRTTEELLCALNPNRELSDGAVSDRRPLASPLRIGELAHPSSQNNARKGTP